MSYRTIFVPMSGSERDRPGLAAAFTLAKRYGAHVDGVFARLDPSDTVPAVGEGMASTLVDQLIDAAEQESLTRLGAAQKLFEDMAKAAGMRLQAEPPSGNVATASFADRLGRDDEVVRWGCGLADVVVVGHEHGSEDGLQLTLTLETALIFGGRPVLLAPHAPPPVVGRSVLVAWNANTQSIRALAAGMPMIHAANEVHVVSVDTRRTDKSSGEELARYLAWHEVEAKTHLLEQSDEHVGGRLLRTAADIGADVMIMGAYSHSRVREMILGGVTRYMLTHAGMPILMAH
jgi:nucleotide-binding universal stress UspA family protein